MRWCFLRESTRISQPFTRGHLPWVVMGEADLPPLLRLLDQDPHSITDWIALRHDPERSAMVLHGHHAERADLAYEVENPGFLFRNQPVPGAASFNKPLCIAVNVQNPSVKLVLARIISGGRPVPAVLLVLAFAIECFVDLFPCSYFAHCDSP